MKKIIYSCVTFLLLFATAVSGQIPNPPLPPNNAIFNGSEGDGWIISKRAKFGDRNNIFNGGVGDGWIISERTEFGDRNNIFNGGDGDGWEMSAIVAYNTANNIYNGGIGDGWANVLRQLGPLPVSLFSFEAEKKLEFVKIHWITASEQNTHWFVIERSMDARNFVPVGKVEAAGESNGNRNYSFMDEHPEMGNNFYRLKMVDRDGTSTYSSVILVKFDGENMQIIAFPNPVREWVNLKLFRVYNRDIPSQIFDQSGKIVFQGYIPKGTLQHRFNIGNLPAGSYFIRLVLPEGQRVIRIIR